VETREEWEIKRETQETKEGTPEMQEVEQEKVNEIRGNKDKDEHTQVELRGDNEVELGECFVILCEQQDGLLEGRGETICSLEADCDEVSPIGPNEVERMSAVNRYTRSLGE